MAKDWGLKITKSGVATTTTDPRDMLFSTKYQMFKYHGEYTKSLVLNSGSSSVTGSVAHNLGYVPAFITYGVRSDNGANFIVPLCPPHIGMEGINACDFITVDTWADINNIYYEVKTPFGTYHEYVYQDGYTDIDYWSSYGGEGYFRVGRIGSSGKNGAVRFTGVEVSRTESVSACDLSMFVGFMTGTSDVDHIKWRNYGIDEDNTSAFGDPSGRPKTTAMTLQDRTVPHQLGDYVGINMLSQFNEIRTRNGWSSGNAMGFFMQELDADDNASFGDAEPAYSYMTIKKPGSVTVSFRTIVFKDKIHD